ncbi:MAG: RidA family protein [Deltaproteobacteria bacterium]|nr:RidA family protein [Deltaproteobacteria bacterium]
MHPKFIPHVPPRIYSKACVYGNLIFLAGEDCKDPRTQKIRGSTVAEQADYLFQNMKATLESLGSSLDNVVSLTAYVTDPRAKEEYREARLKHLPHSPPSALICAIMLADPEMLIEIQAVAVVPEKG